MAGTIIGGRKAAQRNKELYGSDFYQRIGTIGGRRGKADGTVKGFALDPERARRAGRVGGVISRRGK